MTTYAKTKFYKFFVILLIVIMLAFFVFVFNAFGPSKTAKTSASKGNINEQKFISMAEELAKEYSRDFAGLSASSEIKMACEAVLNLDYEVCQNGIATESIRKICRMFTVNRNIAVHECEGFDENKVKYSLDVPIDEETCKGISSGKCSGLEKEKEGICRLAFNMDIEECKEAFKSEYLDPKKECNYAINLFKAFSQDGVSSKEKEAFCEKSLAGHSGAFQEYGVKVCKAVVNKNCSMYGTEPEVTQNQKDYAWFDVSVNNRYNDGCKKIQDAELRQSCFDGIKKIKELPG